MGKRDPDVTNSLVMIVCEVQCKCSDPLQEGKNLFCVPMEKVNTPKPESCTEIKRPPTVQRRGRASGWLAVPSACES